MNFMYLILAIIVLFLTFIFVKICSKNFKTSILTLLIGFIITIFILIFPFIESSNWLSKIVTTVIYVVRTITFNQDLSILVNIQANTFYEWIYVGLIYTLFLLIPLATTTFLISLIDEAIYRIKSFISRKNKVYVFSEINEKTLAIASKLDKKDVDIIFLDTKERQLNDDKKNEIKAMKGIILHSNVNNIKLKNINNRKVEFYLFSLNIDKNLEDAISITEKYHDNTNFFEVFVLTLNEVHTAILDSLDKGNIKLQVINENERIVYQLINNKPLYLDAIDNNISVLLISDDNIIYDFIKAITWCGQLIDYKLTITVLGDNACDIKEYIKINCPELLDNYNYNFISHNLYSSAALTEMNNIKNINYVVIANKDDDTNVLYSIFLRKYFLNQDKLHYKRVPIINVMIKNDFIARQVKLLKNEKNIFYELNTFGSIESTYKENCIIDSELEDLAKNVHLSYDSSDDTIDVKLKKFYDKEYFIRSSRATALHLNYKIFSVLKDKYKPDKLAENFELFKEKIKDEKVFEELARNEHDRWVAYMRTEGYKSVDVEEVAKYRDTTQNYVHFLAKLHPAIVPYDDLPRVSRELKKEDILTNDKSLIENMAKENKIFKIKR